MKYNYERWIITILVFFLIVVYYDKRETIREMEETIVEQSSKIDELSSQVEQLLDEREDLVSTIDLRESEVSFWGRLSDLYREGKKKEALELRKEMQNYEPKY